MRLINADTLHCTLAKIPMEERTFRKAVETIDIIPTMAFIPDNATNGDFITMFIPHESITVCKEKQFVIVIGKDYLFQHYYPLDWWNAKYPIYGESEG